MFATAVQKIAFNQVYW